MAWYHVTEQYISGFTGAIWGFMNGLWNDPSKTLEGAWAAVKECPQTIIAGILFLLLAKWRGWNLNPFGTTVVTNNKTENHNYKGDTSVGTLSVDKLYLTELPEARKALVKLGGTSFASTFTEAPSIVGAAEEGAGVGAKPKSS